MDVNEPDFLKKGIENIDYLSVLKKILKTNDMEKYEAEARLGRIVDKKTGVRYNIRAKNPVIFSKPPRGQIFNSGIDKWDFKALQEPFKNHKKTSHSDKMFCFSNKIRLKVTPEGAKSWEQKILKQSITIHFPNNKYDVRITIMEEKRIMGVGENERPAFIRERDRVTYETRDFYYDFTVVKNSENTVYEVEVELNISGNIVNDLVNAICNLNVIKMV